MLKHKNYKRKKGKFKNHDGGEEKFLFECRCDVCGIVFENKS